jgi:adenosylcobyric acid synthase
MATGTLMLQGTGSDVGKSVLTAGLARACVNRGLTVRPFKPQNMSNNAAIAADGGEIGRAQWLQAMAAKVAASHHMNPVLLKPDSEGSAQVVIRGQAVSRAEAGWFRGQRQAWLETVIDSFDRLRGQADLVLVEGAGSAAEVNLRAGDIANMGFARPTNTPVVLVADINRGGVIAAVVGTKAVLEPADQAMVKGFIINQFRGNPALFDDGYRLISKTTGWPGFGVLPYVPAARRLPAEDAVVLEQSALSGVAGRKVVVPKLPRIANFDDFDPLVLEPGVDLVFCPPGKALPGDAALIILPGSKATIADLRFLKQQGWDIDIQAHIRRGGHILGVCGGYQMLGHWVHDPDGIEGAPDRESGLGLLDVETVLEAEKITQDAVASVLDFEAPICGYEIHVGRTDAGSGAQSWLNCGGRVIGHRDAHGQVEGGYLHGLFGNDDFRRHYLRKLGLNVATDLNFNAAVESALDDLAAAMERHLDIDGLLKTAGL